MPQFTDVSATDARALALITEYFSDRELSFPSTQGTYRPNFPAPEQFLPPRGVFLLVSGDEGENGRESGGSFVGCGGIRRIEDSRSGATRYEVKHLWLQPNVRGRGWSRQLLGELERRATGFGAAEVVLDTHKSLTAAGALYQSSGYVDTPPYNENPNATNWYLKRLGVTNNG